MNTDIRLLCSFKGHRKRMRLRTLIGDRYLDYLVDLWLTVAQDRPDGILSGWDEKDIAWSSGYEGEPKKLVEALTISGFLDKKEDVFFIHDWTEHQGWASSAKKRSEAARYNAQKKWDSRLYNTNPEQNKIKRSERLANAREKMSHSKEEWNEMVVFFENTCVKCFGATNLNGVVKDHIIPIYQGGCDGIKNIQPLCAKCNASKGPENIDYRIDYCKTKNIEMPAKWLQNACKINCDFCQTSAPSPNPSPNPSPIPTYNNFDHFWKAYPVKVSKKQAQKTWDKLQRTKELPPIEDLITAIENQKLNKEKLKQAGEFCPEWKHPSTWLNSGCWLDECGIEKNTIKKAESYAPIN